MGGLSPVERMKTLGLLTEGYELHWEAYNTPKLKHNSANIDAHKTPILAVTVKINTNNIKTLRIAHTNANDTEEKVYIAEEFLYRDSAAQTYYYDLTSENWNNYTHDGDHDFIEIGFQGAQKMNLLQSNSYGDLVIEKIEFLRKLPHDNSIIEFDNVSDNLKKWNVSSSDMSITEAD